MKHDCRHKARLVADSSLTPELVENIYAGAVSLRHLRLVIFLGELNNLELWGADIGNVYLETYTHEKLFIIADREFEELEGFILIDMIYIKTQVFRLLRYYSPAPRNITRSDWASQIITHNMTSSIIQPYGLHSL